MLISVRHGLNFTPILSYGDERPLRQTRLIEKRSFHKENAGIISIIQKQSALPQQHPH
jgi:hypothetical protein